MVVLEAELAENPDILAILEKPTDEVPKSQID